jgi:hypothetical protein
VAGGIDRRWYVDRGNNCWMTAPFGIKSLLSITSTSERNAYLVSMTLCVVHIRVGKNEREKMPRTMMKANGIIIGRPMN